MEMVLSVALYHFIFYFLVKKSQRKHGDAIYKRETFHFSNKCPLLCFLEFPSNGNVVGCFQ